MKTLRMLCGLLILSSLFLASCYKEQPKNKPSTLTVDKTSIMMAAAGGSATLNITANVSWQLIGLPHWITVDKTSGNGNAQLTLSVNSNSGDAPLSAALTLSAPEVTDIVIHVVQSSTTPFLLVDKTTLTETGSADKQTIVVNSNTRWTLSMPAALNWITADKTSGAPGSTTVQLSIAANTIGNSRTGELTFVSASSSVSPVKLTINQASSQVPASLAITSFTLHAKGGDAITISGSGFSETPSNNIVKVNGHTATVTAATTTSLNAIVPARCGDGLVTVSVGSTTATSTNSFTYDWVGKVSTLAGSGTTPAFNLPYGVAVDASGNVFVADAGNNRICKVSPQGQVTTIAGSGVAGWLDNSNSMQAQFNSPFGLTMDMAGNVYVVDRRNQVIRKIGTGGVSTIAGTPFKEGMQDGTPGLFGWPAAIALDAAGNLYVADEGNNAVRKIVPTQNNSVSTVAGGGTTSVFSGLKGIALDASGNIYVADQDHQSIKKIAINGAITTVAGSGVIGWHDDNGTKAQFNRPVSVAVDASGNLYVADQGNHVIRRIAANGAVSTIAGNVNFTGNVDGTGADARFTSPQSITLDTAGNLYVADSGNNTIRKIELQ